MQKPKYPVKIFDGIHWVGVINPELRRFDVVMETEFGTTYNAYLVQGAEKIALIDTVKDGFLQESIALISQLTDPSKIDYIILQHTEPDHSGSIAQLMKLAPNARILCTKPASLYLPHIANEPLPIDVVKDGDEIDLGGRKLRFLMAPFLHWPDTMFTYDESTGALFTCDAFGCHFSTEQVLESKTDEAFKGARRYYYDCIMSPFAPHVAKAVAKLHELGLSSISVILPSHGPVLDQNPLEGVALYEEWAKECGPLTGKRVFIGYVTCYGYTRRMAQHLQARLEEKGATVDIVDMADIPECEAAERILKADVLAIGSPTVNADALPPVLKALLEVPIPRVRGRFAAAFGSYGWSGEAVPIVEQRLTNLGYKMLGAVKSRFCPNGEAYREMEELADKILGVLKV